MREHQLVRTEDKRFRCTACLKEWRSRPKTQCVGVPIYESIPKGLKSEGWFASQNLKPTGKPQGYYCNQYLYDPTQSEIDDPTLPPIYPYGYASFNQLKEMGLKSEQEWADADRKPKENARPRAVIWINNRWQHYYAAEDCEWSPKDRYICKSTLKRKQGGYSLSDGWIKRLEAWMKESGHSVLETENPHYKHAAPMRLYLRSVVQEFLALNAEDYCTWLDKQQRYIELFEQNREAIMQGRQVAEQRRIQQIEQRRIEAQQAVGSPIVAQSFSLDLSDADIRKQTIRCLSCASGIITDQGFLCVIHQYELPQIPCPDWSNRNRLH
jgi:hypothetical protein